MNIDNNIIFWGKYNMADVKAGVEYKINVDGNSFCLTVKSINF